MASRKESLRVANLAYMYDDKFRNLSKSSGQVKKELNVFSMPYTMSIIPHLYEGCPVAVCSGDFNGLRTFNNNYGEKQGDIAMYNSLLTIMDTFPTGSMCCRIGGDEFIFVIPNCNQEESEKYIEEITLRLEENHRMKETEYLTMGLGSSADSQKTFQDLLAEADTKLSQSKNLSISNESLSKRQLLNTAKLLWNQYFDARRIPRDSFSGKNTEKNLPQITTLFRSLISKFPEETFKKQKDSKDYLVRELVSSKLNINVAKVHQYLTNGIDNDVENDDLRELLNFLSKNKVTERLNKKYLEKQLIYKLKGSKKTYDSEYLMLSVHITGLKESNDSHGYGKTDESLKNSCDIIEKNVLQELSVEKGFNHKNLSFHDDDNFMIDLNGGDILCIIHTKNLGSQSENQIHESLIAANEKINLEVQTENSDFHIISDYTYVKDTTKDILTTINDLKNSCEAKTLQYKEGLENPNHDLIQIIFENFLVNFAKQNPTQEQVHDFCNTLASAYTSVVKERQNDVTRG